MVISYARTALVAFAVCTFSAARAQPLPTTVDICMLQDVGAGVLRVSLRSNDQPFGAVLSSLVFTIRWPESSSATLGVGTSAWCAPSQAFQPGPTATVTPGNGFKYKSWTTFGTATLNSLVDDGGCGQTLLADTWTEVLVIPVNNGAGTVFQLTNDAYTAQPDVNRNFFISLNGVEENTLGDPLAGTICSTSTNINAQSVHNGGLGIQPNPASNTIKVTAPEGAFERLTITDATGRLVVEVRWNALSMGQDLDVASLAAGTYSVQLYGASGAVLISKFMKR